MDRLKFADETHPGFYEAVKQRVDDYFDRTGKTRFADRTVLAKGLVYAAAVVASYVVAVSGRLEGLGSLALAALCGIATLLLAINLAHDAAHNCLSSSRRLNRVITTACFMLLGTSGYLWQQRHVRSHHVFPNVNGCDIDIDENPLLRLSPNHARRPMHRWQYLYAPLAYMLVSLHTVFIQDFVYLFKTELANMRNIRHRRREYVVFAAGKFGYLIVALGLPTALSPFAWWEICLAYLLSTFAGSAVFVYLLIGTHFCEEAQFPQAGPEGRLPHDWATHALATSADWSPTSMAANTLVGGANAHAAHHLFPNVCHVHYPAITRIIQETAAEFGVPYNLLSLPAMIASHVRFLRRMGAPEPDPTLAYASSASLSFATTE